MVKEKKDLRSAVINIALHLLGWMGVAIVYYFIFSIFFDTPIEHELRKTNRELVKQYDILSSEYESVSDVLTNVEERDKNIYSMLFESDPYSSSQQEGIASEDVEALLSKTNNELAEIFFEKLNHVKNESFEISSRFDTLQKIMQEKDSKLDYIPAIQPVVNKELTRLAASYGMRIHPFYKNLVSHQGIDYAIPEESRIFVTADGRVSDVSTSSSGKGLTITVDHLNGYKTMYGNLNKATVRRGQSVKRGDIIAHSGNSGMSFMPHLHYEIIKNGMRVDPINYFFMELNHRDNIKLQDIAKIGMQSLD